MARWLAGDRMAEALRVSGGGFALNVEGKGKPKDPASYTVVGQSLPRVDLPPKILGRATYSTDVRVPGMLHGRVIRPAGAGAKLAGVDESSVKAIPGYVKTVVQGNFVGVVAESEWGAVRAAKELKVNWGSPAASFPDDVYRHMRSATAQGDAGTHQPGRRRRGAGAAPQRKWRPATSGRSRRTPPWGRGARWWIFTRTA